MVYFIVKFVINMQDLLVVDDYYKEGKVYNVNYQKVENVCKLCIMIDLFVSDGQIVLEFYSGIFEKGNVLKLSFYYVMLVECDVLLFFIWDVNGIYCGFVE